MVLRVPFIDMIEAGMALFLGVLTPMPPNFVFMFISSMECRGIVSFCVIDLIMDVLMLSNSLAVLLSQLSQVCSVQVDVRAYA